MTQRSAQTGSSGQSSQTLQTLASGCSSQSRLEKIFQSVQNLQLLLLSDIHSMATTNGLSTKWGRAYHGNATEHGEQSEVEGTHDSMAVCRIVRRFNAKDATRYPREVGKRELG
jgi:hypothetical protein